MRKNLPNMVIALITVTVAIFSIVYFLFEIVSTSKYKGDFITNKEYTYEFQYDKRAI